MQEVNLLLNFFVCESRIKFSYTYELNACELLIFVNPVYFDCIVFTLSLSLKNEIVEWLDYVYLNVLYMFEYPLCFYRLRAWGLILIICGLGLLFFLIKLICWYEPSIDITLLENWRTEIVLYFFYNNS